jgi:hypothetical protein
MKTILLAIALVMLAPSGVKADGVTAYVLTQELSYTATVFSETLWTFVEVNGVHNDPFPFVVDGKPFSVALFPYPIPEVDAMYGTQVLTGNPQAGASVQTFFSLVHLTDVDGFIAGLPGEATPKFDCNAFCSQYIEGAGTATEQLDWLDTHLPGGTAAVPEPSTLALVGLSSLVTGFLRKRIHGKSGSRSIRPSTAA